MESSFPATAFLKEPRVASRPARVTFQDGGLLIEADGFSALWPIDSLRFSPGGDEKQFLIVTSPESERLFDSLVVNDPSLLEALASRADEKGRLVLASFDRGRRKTKRDKWLHMGLFALLALGLLALAFWGIERFLVQEVVKRTPIRTEVAWGGKLVGLYTAGRSEVQEGPAHAAAATIWNRLVEAAEGENPGYPLVLHVVRDPGVNAFALPGGHVVLLTGLMAKAESPEEVAGVLAHEIQHVLKRHVTGRLAQSVGTRLLIASVFGGSDLSTLTLTAQQLGELSYGRGQEVEADTEGARLMAKSGLSPAALGAFFARLEKGEKAARYLPTFLSTHPESGERARRLEALSLDHPVARPRPFAFDWARARKDAANP